MDLEPCFIDIETFIQEIENRPALWDVDHPDYRSKSAKKACWEELAEMFGDCDNIERLRLLGSVLQKKWKNLRDNYAKELKKQKQGITDSDGKKHVQYVYFERLSFLDKSVSTRGGTSNIFPELYVPDQEESMPEAPPVQVEETPVRKQPSPAKPSPAKPSSAKPVRVIKISDRAHPYSYYSNPVFVKNKEEPKARELEQDGDKHFCLGLYKELKKVAEHARMQTKIELMEVIQRAQMEGSGKTAKSSAFTAAPSTRTVTRYLVNYPPQKPGSSPVPPKIMPISSGAPLPKLPLPKLSTSKGGGTTTAPQTITLIIPDQTLAAAAQETDGRKGNDASSED